MDQKALDIDVATFKNGQRLQLKVCPEIHLQLKSREAVCFSGEILYLGSYFFELDKILQLSERPASYKELDQREMHNFLALPFLCHACKMHVKHSLKGKKFQ